MSARILFALCVLVLAACDLETIEEKRDRELREGKEYLRNDLGVDPRILYAGTLPAGATREEPPAANPLGGPPPEAVVYEPLAVTITGGALRLAFSSVWAGPVASIPIELAPGFRLSCRIRFSELPYNSCAALLVVSESDALDAPEVRFHSFIAAALCGVVFQCQGGGEALVNNMGFRGKGMQQVNINLNAREPAFLATETYELSLQIDREPATCALRPTSWAARDYSPVLRMRAREKPTPSGRYRLLFWASPRYPQLAVMEVTAVAIERGRVLPIPESAIQSARRAFCASDFGNAVSRYDACAREGQLESQDEDALAFARVRSGSPLDAAWLAAALGRHPNCERLLRLWAADRLRQGDLEALFERAEQLAKSKAPGSPRLAEWLEELAENAPEKGK